MRNFAMIEVARKMDDLYNELIEKHGWHSSSAREMVVAFFTEGYSK